MRELWLFLKVRKKLWLGPLFALLVLLGLIAVTAQSSGLGALLYPLF
jgi:hypothetical protein